MSSSSPKTISSDEVYEPGDIFHFSSYPYRPSPGASSAYEPFEADGYAYSSEYAPYTEPEPREMGKSASDYDDAADQAKDPDDTASEASDDTQAGQPCWWCGTGEPILPRYTNQTDRPCDTCDRINVHKFLSHERDSYDPEKKAVRELGWADEVAFRRNCPLCRLAVHCIRTTYPVGLPSTFWEDSVINGERTKIFIETFLPQDHDFKIDRTAFGCLLFTTEPALDELLGPLEIADTTKLVRPHAALLAEGCLRRMRGAFGGAKRRRLWPTVDLELLSSWISTCLKVHQYICGDLPTCLRVVDLKTTCLVDPPPNCRYVALSYVWGGPQAFSLKSSTRDSLYEPGSLTTDNGAMPWTIRDFMVAVTGIGERYAWIDALCVIQDDATDVRQHVQVMDSIYSNAVFTIAAASGTSAQSGLAGLRPGTRQDLQGRELSERTAVGAPLPGLDDTIEKSTWNSRGWTYQENVLSQRMLFFTDGQVHFRCKRGCTACEETWEDGYDKTTRPAPEHRDAPLHSHQPNVAKTGAVDAHHGVFTNMGWWWMHVRAMSGRKTTSPKDRLHALEGVLQQLQSLFDGHGFAWGVPTAALDIGLLWRPMEGSTCLRNDAVDNSGAVLPSWSWVGWTGAVNYRMWNICEATASDVEWIDMTKGGTTKDCRFSARTCRAPTQDWLKENGWTRETESEAAPGVFYRKGSSDRIRYAHPIAFEPSKGPALAVDWKTGELNFFAKSAKYSIPSSHIKSRKQNPSAPDEGGNMRHLCLFDNDGHVAGVVVADPDKLLAMKQGMFECIAIVETTLSRTPWDLCWSDETGRFIHPSELPVWTEPTATGSTTHGPGYLEGLWARISQTFGGSRAVTKPSVGRRLPNMDATAEWDFYKSCVLGPDILPCPYHDTRAEGESHIVSPLRTINPTYGPFPFDPRYYSTLRPWPLYEILLIERRGDIAYRVGIGYVHYDAFYHLQTEKHIRLR